MKPSTFLTAGEAAKATGKTVPTITRAIKSGRILGGVRKGENGEYQIDPSALFSVYPMINAPNERNSNATPQTQGDVTPQFDTAYTAAIDALKETIAAKDALINEKDATINDYKARLAKSENLLTDQRNETDRAKEKLFHSETLLTNQEKPDKKLAEEVTELRKALQELSAKKWFQFWK